MSKENDRIQKSEEDTTIVIKKPLSKKTEKEQELLKKIAYHEVYSTAYKLSLAKILLVKGARAASKAAVKGGKFVKSKYVEVKERKADKNDQ